MCLPFLLLDTGGEQQKELSGWTLQKENIMEGGKKDRRNNPLCSISFFPLLRVGNESGEGGELKNRRDRGRGGGGACNGRERAELNGIGGGGRGGGGQWGNGSWFLSFLPPPPSGVVTLAR